MAHIASRATRLVLTAALVIASSAVAFCQTSYQRVPKGTEVPLELTAPLSTRDASAGQHITLKVAEDVWAGMTLLLPKGADTTALISEVSGPKNWGRGGKIALTFGEIEAADGTPLALSALTKQRQETKGYAAGATLGGAAILGPVGLVGGAFVKGKHLDYPAGHRIWAEVAWETAVKKNEATFAAAPNPAAVVGPPPAAPAAPAAPAVAPQPAAPVVVTPAPAPAPKPTPAAPAVTPAPPKDTVAPVIPVIEDVPPAAPANKK